MRTTMRIDAELHEAVAQAHLEAARKLRALLLTEGEIEGAEGPVSDPDPSSPLVSVEVACALLGCGKTKVFELLRRRELVKVPNAPGVGTFIGRASVLSYRERLIPTGARSGRARRGRVASEPPTDSAA